MKDFPVFTTEYGVASLVLREIPYRGEAYITILSSEDPALLLEECVSFCRVVGAEKVFARGHDMLEQYPLHSVIYEMSGVARVDESQVDHLFPVTQETVGKWRQLINERMAGVDNAGTLAKQGEKEILQLGGAYFVHREGKLLGAGWITGGELMLIASFERGAGERVMHTLLSTVKDENVKIQVVSSNHRAIRLYERMGFVRTAELRRWYRVL